MKNMTANPSQSMTLADMENGVSRYTKATVDIYFPEDHVACRYCPILETYSRNQCRRTGEYLVDTQHTVRRNCPLKFEEVE